MRKKNAGSPRLQGKKHLRLGSNSCSLLSLSLSLSLSHSFAAETLQMLGGWRSEGRFGSVKSSWVSIKAPKVYSVDRSRFVNKCIQRTLLFVSGNIARSRGQRLSAEVLKCKLRIPRTDIMRSSGYRLGIKKCGRRLKQTNRKECVDVYAKRKLERIWHSLLYDLNRAFQPR